VLAAQQIIGIPHAAREGGAQYLADGGDVEGLVDGRSCYQLSGLHRGDAKRPRRDQLCHLVKSV
jgi:hypothetical protein